MFPCQRYGYAATASENATMAAIPPARQSGGTRQIAISRPQSTFKRRPLDLRWAVTVAYPFTELPDLILTAENRSVGEAHREEQRMVVSKLEKNSVVAWESAMATSARFSETRGGVCRTRRGTAVSEVSFLASRMASRGGGALTMVWWHR